MDTAQKLRKVGRFARWLILVACIVYLALFFSRNRGTLEIALTLNGKLLAGMIGLQLLYYPIQAFRLHTVIGQLNERRPEFGSWLQIFIVGRFLNMVISQAGNLYRADYLKRQHGISYAHYVGGLLSITWVDVCLSLLLAIAAVLVFEPGLVMGGLLLWQVCAVLLVLAVVTPIVAHTILSRLSFRRSSLDWIRRWLSVVAGVTAGSVRDIKPLVVVVGLGLVGFARTVLALYLYFRVFDLEASLPQLTAFNALFALGSLIIITPGNVGIQELAWGFLGREIGIGMAQGVIISGFGRIISTAIVVCLGVVCGGIGALRSRAGVLEHPDSENGVSS